MKTYCLILVFLCSSLIAKAQDTTYRFADFLVLDTTFIYDPALDSAYNDLVQFFDTVNPANVQIIVDSLTLYDEIKNDTSSYKTSTAVYSNWWANLEPQIQIPPSPESQGLIKQIEESVNQYTGGINLNIPLHTLKSHDLELPITLNYNSTGVKVASVASMVGLEWNLNAGGAITRVVNGFPDEFETDRNIMDTPAIPVYGYTNIKDRISNIDSDGGYLNDFEDFSPSKKEKIIRNANYMNIDDVDGEAWDTTPDDFYFSFGNYSGKFVFDQDGNIQLISNHNLQIEFTKNPFTYNGSNFNQITEFVITTDRGVKYTFGGADLKAVELTSRWLYAVNWFFKYHFLGTSYYADQYIGSNIWSGPKLTELETQNLHIDNYHTSTWHLKKIESPNGDYIDFEYKGYDIPMYDVQIEESVTLPNLTQVTLSHFDTPQKVAFISLGRDTYPQSKRQVLTRKYNMTLTDVKHLDLITTSTQNKVDIKFSNSVRQDIVHCSLTTDEFENAHLSKEIYKIEIRNSENKIVKEYGFQFDYNEPDYLKGPARIIIGNAIGIYDYTNIIHLNAQQKRLILKEISIGQYHTERIPIYKFEYDPQILPSRTSYKIDKYGYFNNNRFGTKIPKFSYISQLGGVDYSYSGLKKMNFFNKDCEAPLHTMKGGDRSSNLEKSQAGILKKIIYPTNGVKEFFYELNEDDGVTTGGLRVSSIREYPDKNYPNKYLETNYEYYNGESVKGVYFKYEAPAHFPNWYDVHVSSAPLLKTYNTKGGVVGYEKVIEVKPGMGKVITTFNSPKEFKNEISKVFMLDGTAANGPGSLYENMDVFPFPPDTDYDWKRGIVTNVKYTLENEEDVLKEQLYDYTFDPNGYTTVEIFGLTPGTYHFNGDKHYFGGVYKNVSAQVINKKTSEFEYNSLYAGNRDYAVEKTIENNYEFKEIQNRQYGLLRNRSTNTSSGKSYKTEFKYPVDYYNTPFISTVETGDDISIAINEMLKRGVYTQPIEELLIKVEDTYDKVVNAKLNSFNLNSDDNIILRGVEVFNSKEGRPYTMFFKSEINNDLGNYSFSSSRFYENKFYYHKYDVYANLLQYSKHFDQIENKPTSFIWGYNDSEIIAKIDNAYYWESGHTSFENGEGNGWDHEDLIVDDEIARTGRSSLELDYHQLDGLGPSRDFELIDYSETNKGYKASVWVNSNLTNAYLNMEIKDMPGTQKRTYSTGDNKWELLEVEFSAEDVQPYLNNGNKITVSIGNINPKNSISYFDDLKFYPIDASINLFTHSPTVGLTSTTNERNLSIHYDYDHIGRLSTVKDFYGNIIEKYEYNYCDPPFLNVEESNFNANSIGETIVVNVETNTEFTVDENSGGWLQTSINGNELTINVDPNSGTSSREATITLGCREGLSDQLLISQDFVLLTADFSNEETLTEVGQSFSVPITSTAPWNVSFEGLPLNHYITVTPMSGTNNGIIEVTCANLTTYKVVKIQISNDYGTTITEPIIVKRPPTPPPPPPFEQP